MYLVSANPHNHEGEYLNFSDTVSYAGNKEQAQEAARKTAANMVVVIFLNWRNLLYP